MPTSDTGDRRRPSGSRIRTTNQLPMEIARRCPEWPEVYGRASEATFSFFVATGDAKIIDPASASTILLQGANEFQDLLLAASEGAGRRALASARTLYELSVALQDVLADPSMDERYAAWGDVADYLVTQLPLEERALRGTELKSYLHARKKAVKSSKPAYEAAIAKNGTSFRRDWTGGRTLYDRAVQHGQDDLYDFYRVASGVLHGTEAGALGLRRHPEPGFATTRLGHALQWTPTALLYGVESFDRLAGTSSSLLAVGTSEVGSAVRAIRHVWPDYRKAIREVDEDLWPDEPVITRVAVYGIGPNKSGRWFVWDPQLGRIAPAMEPGDIPQHAKVAIERMRQEAERLNAWTDPTYPRSVLGYVSIVVEELQVERVPGEAWRHEGEVMIQDPFDRYDYKQAADEPE